LKKRLVAHVILLAILSGCASHRNPYLLIKPYQLSNPGEQITIHGYLYGWKKGIKKYGEKGDNYALGVPHRGNKINDVLVQIYLPILGSFVIMLDKPKYGKSFEYNHEEYIDFINSVTIQEYDLLFHQEVESEKEFLKTMMRDKEELALVIEINEVPNYRADYDVNENIFEITWSRYYVNAIGFEAKLYSLKNKKRKMIFSYTKTGIPKRIMRFGDKKAMFEKRDDHMKAIITQFKENLGNYITNNFQPK